MSQDGFLCVVDIDDEFILPALAFTTAESSQSVCDDESLLDDVEGYGTIVAWGLAVRGEKDSMNVHFDVLWRPEYVLYQEGTVTTSEFSGRTPPDVANFMYPGDVDRLESLQMIKAASVEQIAGDNGLIENLILDNDEVFYIPPPDKRKADKLWKAICRDIDRISVMWTDFSERGLVDGSFKWYGLDSEWNEELEIYETIVRRQIEGAAPEGHPEHYSEGNRYLAVWTSRTARWPKAIKVQIWFKDEILPPAFEKSFEVICDIP